MARQQVVKLDNVGFSPWLFMDNRALRNPFNVGVQVTLAPNSNLTWSVEATKDRQGITRIRSDLSIARALTVATATLLDHGLKTGDNVVIYDTNFTTHNPESNLEGRFDITVVDKDTFTYTVVDTGAAAASPARIQTFNVHELNGGLTNGTTGANELVTEPVSAFRLKVTAFVQGSATLTLLQQG